MPARPIRKKRRKQDALQAPLNRVLGSETHVRILRALTGTRVPVSSAELARRILMDKAGVWRSVATLRGLGVLEAVGVGAQQQFRLRREYPLYNALAHLFDEERGRLEQLHQRIRGLAGALQPPPIAVWIEHSTQTEDDIFGDSIVLGVLDSSGRVTASVETMRNRITELEKELQISVDIRGLTKADLATLSRSEQERINLAFPIAGPPPASLLDDGGRGQARGPKALLKNHRDLDARALALAGSIAEKIRRDPSLIERAQDYTRKRSLVASAAERRELEEWSRVLHTMSPAALGRFLVSKTERATRLRQTLPFMDVLSGEERNIAVRRGSATHGLQRRRGRKS